ncbi:hypothetical protein SAMN05216227_1007118 [Pseudorhodobacter antarcticus]|uniref:Hemolysin-type calcium-binding repeat-containing protein n=1 Tax=Pseudorhodobacter antarcticus TaxID=1077947 RepID=A0A1H8DST4_9RHOB|nr:calcium-binding protein [Pseudorhodobacter antarcticus]SEN10235.1 hypothetical protein SAMN05216227_1007118 [Pseudorhodobacter antarcticus]
MDPVLAPFMLLFLGTLSLDLGLFNNNDDTPEDAVPAADPAGASDTAPITDAATPPSGVADPDEFDATLYTEVVNGTDGANDLSAEGRSALAWFLVDGDDSLDGSLGNDYVEGGAGDDSMNLRDGRDLAYGGAGDDSIDAGIGFDTVFGGDGTDTLIGNGGNDV